MIEELEIRTPGRGLHEITAAVQRAVAAAGVDEGLCTIFIRHTSASLTIQENADPSARADLDAWMHRFVPEGQPWFTHTDEGADDMPSHIRAALTATTLTVPIAGGRLLLGTWQGIYVWEHRRRSHTRRVVVHVTGDAPR